MLRRLKHVIVGAVVDFDKLGDVHIPAAILKSFLRQLPEPLLTYELYDHIIHVQCQLLVCVFHVCVYEYSGCDQVKSSWSF